MILGIHSTAALVLSFIAVYLFIQLRQRQRKLESLERLTALHDQALAAAHAQREHRLLSQLQQISTIFDSMNALIYVSDMQTSELLFINAFGKQLFGEHVLGRRCYESLQQGQTAPCAFCTNDRLVRAGEAQPPIAWEFCNTVTGRWFLCIDRAIPWNDGRLVRMEIAVDISERKRAEQFREETISLISHDLRNPLTASSTMAEFLQSRLSARGAVNLSKAAGIIFQNGLRMNAMIDDLLDAAHFDAGTLQMETSCVDMTKILADTVARMATDPARVELSIAADLPSIAADARRIERVIANLLSNAFKYARPNSTIRVALARHAERIRLSVANEGRGIAPEHMPLLFQKYFRAGPQTQPGSGLGLYAVKLIVDAHGGTAWATSIPEETTVFFVDLPICCAEDAEPAVRIASRRDGLGHHA